VGGLDDTGELNFLHICHDGHLLTRCRRLRDEACAVVGSSSTD
jgi:hypothetical protein